MDESPLSGVATAQDSISSKKEYHGSQIDLSNADLLCLSAIERGGSYGGASLIF